MKNKFLTVTTAAVLTAAMLTAAGCSPLSHSAQPDFPAGEDTRNFFSDVTPWAERENIGEDKENTFSETITLPENTADNETKSPDTPNFSEETRDIESGDITGSEADSVTTTNGDAWTGTAADSETRTEAAEASDSETQTNAADTANSETQTAAPVDTSGTENGTVPFVSRLEDYTKKWFYNQLNDPQKIVYQRMFEALSNDRTEFDVKDLDLSDNEYIQVMEIFRLDNPQFFITSYNGALYGDPQRHKATKISLERTRESEEVPIDRFEEKLRDVLTESMSYDNDYDRLKYIHDLIVNETVYVDSEKYPYISRADGPLVYGEALCEGYSAAFMYIAQSLGYECLCVYGTASNSHGESSEHMWNMIKINEEWYHVDVTWDDPVASDGSPRLRHKYFLVSEETVSENHSIEMWAEYPKAENDLNQEEN